MKTTLFVLFLAITWIIAGRWWWSFLNPATQWQLAQQSGLIDWCAGFLGGAATVAMCVRRRVQ